METVGKSGEEIKDDFEQMSDGQRNKTLLSLLLEIRDALDQMRA